MSKTVSTVTFGVIAYNEHQYLPDLLDDLLHQSYDKKLIEVIMVDGESSDDTLEIMNHFKQKYIDSFADIKVLSNPKRIQPSGWNIVIKNSKADVLLRIDAHARLANDFIKANIECINSGENVCGGPRENIIDEDTAWKRTLLTAEQSMFGAGIASYRQETNQKKYINALFHGCYRKEVLEDVGFFNEELIRTEDNEYHYRIREHGYKICYDPGIKSYYQTRNSLKGMLKQKFNNGVWIGKTLFRCPDCLSIFHLVPGIFVCAIVLTTILVMIEISWPAIAMWCVYGAVNFVMTVIACIQSNKISGFSILLPVIFLMLHTSYGLGTVIGILQR